MDANGSIIWKPESETGNYGNSSGLMVTSRSRAESPDTLGAPADSRTFMTLLIQFGRIIKRGSYVGTLIVMMVSKDN